jgi:ABC-type transporter Mla subunit MlaD
LEAVNERRGQLRQLIVNANDTFGALASRNESLAEAIVIFPTFLRESRATFGRLKTFANDTRPLVRDLQPVMTELRPTLRDVGELAPDLENLFRDLGPLIDEAPDTLPAAARFIRGVEPVLEALSPYLREFNPILSYLNFQQQQVADFIMNGGGSFSSVLAPLNANEGPRHYLRAYSGINARSAGISRTRPSFDRGNSYPAPNYFRRARPLGMFEAFDCKPGGVRREPANGEPPCFVQPKSLFDGGSYPRIGRGEAPVRKPPLGNDGSAPARP